MVREVERVKTGQAGSNSAIVINNLVKVSSFTHNVVCIYMQTMCM